MSKRVAGANFGTGEERYGGELSHTMDNDKPMQATAAQMARRKIAQARKPGANRLRSNSPAIPPTNVGTAQGGLFGAPPQQHTQTQFAPSNFSFTFGGQSQQQEANGSPSPFQFGSPAPPPSTQSQPNGNGSMLGQDATSTFGTSFTTGSTQPKQNGFMPSTSFGFNQPSQTPNATSSFTFNRTEQSQQNGNTPATSTGSVFGSFGKPQDNTQIGANSFNIGATQQDKEKSNTPFGSFGAVPQDKERSSTPFSGFGTAPSDSGTVKSSNPFQNFGAMQQEKQESKSITTTGTFGQSQQGSADKPSNPFAGFGQTNQESTHKPSTPSFAFGQKVQENSGEQRNAFGGFGQKQQETSTNSSAPHLSFGQRPAETNITSLIPQPHGKSQESSEKATSHNPFGGFGAAAHINGDKTSTEPQSVKSAPFSLGSTVASQAEKPNTSTLFGGFPQTSQANGEKRGLFGSNLQPATPSSGSESIFSNLPKKNLSNGGKPLFDSSDPSQVYREEDDKDDEEQADTGNNIFNQSRLQTSQPSLFSKAGITSSDVSMTTPENTPSKSRLQAAVEPAATATTSSNGPAAVQSIFDRLDKDDAAKRIDPTLAADAQNAALQTSNSADTHVTATPLLQPSTSSASSGAASMFKPSQPSQLSQSQTPKAPPLRSLFDRIDKPLPQPSGPFTPNTPTASTLMVNGPATAHSTRAVAPPSAQPHRVVATVTLTAPQTSRMKDLNEGILSFLQTEDVEKDWTVIFDHYAKIAAEIRGLPPPAPQALSVNAAGATAPTSVEQSTNSFNIFAKSTTHPAPSATSTGGNLFSQNVEATKVSNVFHAQTPKAPSQDNIFGKVTSTAPAAAKKRPFEQDDLEIAQQPHTEKRSKPSDTVTYPKLPDTASSTAKLFEAAMDTPKFANGLKTSIGGFTPATKPLFASSTSQDTSSAAPASIPQPSGGFKPAFGPPAAVSGNFLSAFGNKAKEQAEKDRKKRKAEDYDSDEETEEQWEQRDREEQAAKRKKFEEAAKNTKGFVLSGTSTPTNDAAPATPFKFGASTANTNSTTPAQPPSTATKLFGSSAQALAGAADSGKLAPPSTGFNFGPKALASTDNSRATTPGVTTDGEASTAAEGDDGEPSDEQHTSQPDTDDHTTLQPSEREASEVLMELKNTTTKKFAKLEEQNKPSWVGVGAGRLYVLKDKANGITRVLNRVGVGRTALNFNLVKGMKYEIHPKKDTMVVATFLDHINHTPPKLDRFFITAETASEAQELARVLTEGAAQ